MSNIITVSYINQIQFLQMPKAFLYNPKYAEMSNESKIIYALLRDLVSLSIQNNWINENNEVYVKFSRTKLAEKVNVSPTNKKKIASLMKELKDLELIIEKPVGLNKCNEIYVCIPEDLAVAYNPADLLGDSELVEKNTPISIDNQGGSKNGTSGGSKNGTSRSSKSSPHINTNSINTNLINKSSLAESAQEREEENIIIKNIEKETGLTLTKSQKGKVSKWDKERIDKAIELFITHSGSSFAYLQKCYYSPVSAPVSAPVSTAPPKAVSKNNTFTRTYSHNWDMAELERREMEYIEKMYGDN